MPRQTKGDNMKKKNLQIRRTNGRGEEKKVAQQFGDYDSRMNQVRKVTAKECEKLINKLQTIYSYASFSKKPEVNAVCEGLEGFIQEVELYQENLLSGEIIYLDEINAINKQIDAEVQKYDAMFEKERAVSTLLDEGFIGSIKNSGYYSLYNNAEMNILAREYIDKQSRWTNEASQQRNTIRRERRAKFYPDHREINVSLYQQSLGLYQVGEGEN